jgi:Kef-type K+ transport system membrane component KefB
MPVEFTNLAIVAAVAFAVPLGLALLPWLRVPALVLEIVAGILIGPQVLGWAELDTPVLVMSTLGVAFLLLLAGLEIDFQKLRGRLLGLTSLAWLASFGLAIAIGFVLDRADLFGEPLLLGIVLSATGLGIVVPIMKDTGVLATGFGQAVIAAASVAEIATIVLLSLFYGEAEGGLGSRLVLFGVFVGFLAVVALVILVGEHVHRVSGALFRLMDTTAQIRVRGAVLLLALLVAAAAGFGLEAVLGAFLAGCILKLTDRDGTMTHSGFHHKLEAVGYGAFIPFFFVASGLRFDVDALFASGSTLAMVPIFLAALLVARGVPALFLRRFLRPGQLLPAALLQATSVSFIVVATSIGLELGVIDEGAAAAFVAAGLLSVIAFPLASLVLLKRGQPATDPGAKARGELGLQPVSEP